MRVCVCIYIVVILFPFSWRYCYMYSNVSNPKSTFVLDLFHLTLCLLHVQWLANVKHARWLIVNPCSRVFKCVNCKWLSWSGADDPFLLVSILSICVMIIAWIPPGDRDPCTSQQKCGYFNTTRHGTEKDVLHFEPHPWPLNTLFLMVLGKLFIWSFYIFTVNNLGLLGTLINDHTLANQKSILSSQVLFVCGI